MYPSVDEIRQLQKEYEVVPVFYEMLSDAMTPVQILKALKGEAESCFILESVDNSQQWGRYSFIGIQPKQEIRLKDGKARLKSAGQSREVEVSDPAAFLKEIQQSYRSPSFPGRPKLTGGLVGYFGYDIIRYFEEKLSHPPKDDLGLPDCHLFLYDELVAYDHLSNKTVIIQNIGKEEDAGEQVLIKQRRAEEIARKIKNYTARDEKKSCFKPRITANLTKEEYMQNVQKAKQHIADGDVFQVVLSQRFEVECPPDAFDVYRMLRASNPSPYLFYLKTPEYEIAGASPEMLVNVTKGIVSTRPIAGTMPRGRTQEQDELLEKRLRTDVKERAEHTMLVDLGRNDVGKISKFGTVEVVNLMRVEKYSKVMHLVSDVKGLLREELSAVDALMAVLPAGTLSGAPKIRAMELIDEMEPNRRGLYGGTVGYLGFDGNIDTCIAIRTALFQNGKAYVQTGAGIVADSDPETEYQETCNKAQAVLKAIEEAASL